MISPGYDSLGDDMLADPAVGLLLNMLHRNFSLADGAILAFATACGEVAEVAARASVESSVNIAYIVLGEPADRMRAYFDHTSRSWTNRSTVGTLASQRCPALRPRRTARLQDGGANPTRSYVR
jgi:hypothetical protein